MNSTFTKISRFLLALILLVFGINKFVRFMPEPGISEHASEFISSLDAAGYILPILGIFEIFIGLLLLFNKWVGFALLALVPISVNIVMYHLFMDIPNIGGAILVAIINFILIYKNWSRYKPLFQ